MVPAAMVDFPDFCSQSYPLQLGLPLVYQESCITFSSANEEAVRADQSVGLLKRARRQMSILTFCTQLQYMIGSTRSMRLTTTCSFCPSMRSASLQSIGTWLLTPCSQEEVDRLEAQHRVLNMVFDGRLVFPPITDLHRVLDLGYGSGAWALEVANNHPGCEVRRPSVVDRALLTHMAQVTGVDISLHMLPDELPDNFEPQVRNISFVSAQRESLVP